MKGICGFMAVAALVAVISSSIASSSYSYKYTGGGYQFNGKYGLVKKPLYGGYKYTNTYTSPNAYHPPTRNRYGLYKPRATYRGTDRYRPTPQPTPRPRSYPQPNPKPNYPPPPHAAISQYKPMKSGSSWDTWGEWSDCTIKCGEGIQNRARHCQTHQQGRHGCYGPSLESRDCVGNQCTSG